MASAAAASSSPSTFTVTVSPCLTPMPIRAISLRRSQLLPSFSRVAVLAKPLATFTSRPAGRAWMPHASLTVYWNSFIIIFSLLHPVSDPDGPATPDAADFAAGYYYYYKPASLFFHHPILLIFSQKFWCY